MGKRGPNAKAKKSRKRPIPGEILLPGCSSLPSERIDQLQEVDPLTWKDETLSMPERIIRFAESLPITSGMLVGEKMRLRDWQKDFIQGVYGPQEDGFRLVRTGLLSIPRKNGKTGLAAILALAHLCGPASEPRGQVFSAASDRNQAAIIFKEMVAIITKTPWMEERLNIRSFNKVIEDTENGSVYEALSSDARKAHGLSPSFVVCDEIAQWKSRELYDNIISGMGARAEPLLIAIGTQSPSDQHLMSELVDYSEKITSGELSDPSFFGLVYKASEDADPWSPATWFACNPALDDFKSLKDMEIAAKRAQRIPTQAGSFKNLHLNMRIDAEVRFLAYEDWRACGDPVDPASLYGRPCWGGLDLSSTTDLTAFILYFPHDGGAVLPFFWLPGDNIQGRSDLDRVPYRAWQEQGLIEATPGRAVDYRFVVAKIAQLAADYDVQAVAFDRWRIRSFERILVEEGVTLPLEEFGQGFRDMAPAVDALEAAVLDRRLRHGNNPILVWNCSNSVVETDPAGNRKLSKKRSREKIDGLVALSMALGICVRQEVQPTFDPENIMVFEW